MLGALLEHRRRHGPRDISRPPSKTSEWLHGGWRLGERYPPWVPPSLELLKWHPIAEAPIPPDGSIPTCWRYLPDPEQERDRQGGLRAAKSIRPAAAARPAPRCEDTTRRCDVANPKYFMPLP